MRILHVVYSLHNGGMEGVLVRVARALAMRGFEFHVCALDGVGELTQILPSPDNVTALHKQPGFSLRTVFQLRQTIRSVAPDLVHTHNLGPLIYTVLGTNLGRFAPILHGEHGQLVDTDLGTRKLRQRRLLYRCCRHIHTVSRELRSQLLATGLAAPNHVTAVVNGVDVEHFAPGDAAAARAALGLPADVPAIGIVGRVSKNKRHSLLVEAVAQLHKQGITVEVVIAGCGPEEAPLKELTSSVGLQSHVHFLGHMSDPRPCYHAIDAMVLPSRQEGLSNAVLEAMACGVPVLVHDACGNKEAITNGTDGWVQPLDDSSKMAECLKRILSTPGALHTIGNAARARVTEQFRFADTVSNYGRLYHTLTGKAPSLTE